VLATASGSPEEHIAAITSLLADLDAGRLKPMSIAARQCDILVGQIAQIRPRWEVSGAAWP
jgi:hypothetical protein